MLTVFQYILDFTLQVFHYIRDHPGLHSFGFLSLAHTSTHNCKANLMSPVNLTLVGNIFLSAQAFLTCLCQQSYGGPESPVHCKLKGIYANFRAYDLLSQWLVANAAKTVGNKGNSADRANTANHGGNREWALHS